MLSCNGDHVVYDTKVLRKYIYGSGEDRF